MHWHLVGWICRQLVFRIWQPSGQHEVFPLCITEGMLTALLATLPAWPAICMSILCSA